ncbi:penicillin-binding protein 1B [Motiliproteus sediminis]|uniref:penicillin-binding protein 1B n=1 Tax=Motiliproteus sediminis TaxID=1468178 RepID=UPI001AEF8B78|nr:penicillin-binding protein 1B [Motiliproteus sediminis]
MPKKSSASPSRRTSKKGAAATRSRSFRWWPLLLKLGLVVLVLGGGALVYMDATIRSQFEGKRWALPAKVYARPLELYAGQRLPVADLKEELRQLGYRFVSYPKRAGEASVADQRALLFSRGFLYADGPEPARLLELRFDGDRIAHLSGSEGALPLARLEPVLVGGIYPADNEDRELVRLQQVPPTLVQALVTVEDRDFYQHFGISPKGIARAMISNLRARAVVQGGSTLTQQLVKNYFLTSERSLWRKLMEAPMAMLLELHYSKDEILESYLNEVYLGQSGSRAIHGFSLASQYYFGRPLADLSLEQQALLAGLVKGPSYYDPRRHPERATERRNLVLSLMRDQGHISDADLLRARQRPLGVVERSQLSKGAFPAYLDLVKRQLRQDYREQDLASEGLQVFTNLDPLVQRKAEQSVQRVIKRLDGRFGSRVEGLQAALVVGNSQTGDVVAVVGGRDPRYQGFNRALDAVRPIGSLVKPAVYLTALEEPQRFTLSSWIDDNAVTLQNPDGSYWTPSNFDHSEHGVVPLHQALSRSYNLATAQLGLRLGVDKVVHTLERLGVRRPVSPYPAVLLGAVNLSPLEVTQVYQTIAANGFETPLRAIRSVLTADGELLSSYPFELQQQFEPAVMHLLQYALQETVREGTARQLYQRFPDSLNMAGKTGTTNDQRDSWFAGFTGDYLAVAWLGQDDNRPTPLTGSSGALQVWSELMAELRPQSYRPMAPESVNYVWIDDATGERTGDFCEGARLLPYVAGSEPAGYRGCGVGIQRTLNWFNHLFGGEGGSR